MNLMAKGKALRDKLAPDAIAPEGTLSYVPKADPGNPVDVTGKAWLGRTVFTRLQPSAGASIVFGDGDALILPSAISGKPDRGDRIIRTVDAVETTYEVIAPAGEPAWRWSDPERTLYRVHMKEVQ